MKHSIIFTGIITLALSSQLVSAGSIADTYTTGTPLTATMMENIRTAVNDNDGRIITNAFDISTNTVNIGINATNITSLQGQPVTPWSLNTTDIYYNTGKIGIGTMNPIDSLHIVGNKLRIEHTSNSAASGLVHVPAADTGYAGIFWVTAADGTSYRANAHYDHTNKRLYYTNAGTSNLTGVYLANGSTSWTSTSDRRLKENIVDTTYGLDTILQIPVREYNFKADDNKQKRIGFIAQEIYPIVPEIVTKGDEGEYTNISTPWGVDVAGLTPILVKSIQELRQIVEAQQNEIEILKAKVGGL